MNRVLVLAAAAVLLAACGTTQSATRSTATSLSLPRPKVLLRGCHRLPYSPGALSPGLAIYQISATPDQICFHYLGVSSTSSVGLARNYGDPIIASDEPRPGDYLTIYYAKQHYWFLVPVGCPCS